MYRNIYFFSIIPSTPSGFFIHPPRKGQTLQSAYRADYVRWPMRPGKPSPPADFLLKNGVSFRQGQSYFGTFSPRMAPNNRRETTRGHIVAQIVKNFNSSRNIFYNKALFFRFANIVHNLLQKDSISRFGRSISFATKAFLTKMLIL